MKLATAAQMREMDRAAIEQYRIPGIVLMENAGRGATETLLGRFRDSCEFGVAVLCGPGNNGGDGFVIARHLFNRGFEVECFLLGARGKLKGDAKINHRIAANLGLPITEIKTDRDLLKAAVILADAGLIVDALFGTGLSRSIEGVAADLIELANELEVPLVAVDMPSGVGSDDGRPTGPAIIADLTCTFGLGKVGQFIHPGCRYCGEIEVIDISLPPYFTAEFSLDHVLLEEADLLPLFGRREMDTNKGTYGHAVILGGAPGMSGAVRIAAEAAVMAGAGLVTAAVPSSLAGVIETTLTEALKTSLAADPQGRLADRALDAALALLNERSAAAVGPGMDRSDGLETFMAGLVAGITTPTVIDADGLNNLAANVAALKDAKAPIVVTPHPGEMARLLGTDTTAVQSDRLGAARRFAAEYGVVTVLKGSRTVVAAPDDRVWINPTGNPGMATGGTGDALTGLIAGFLATGLAALDAALCGVYIHGRAGDLAAAAVGERALSAGVLLRFLPEVLRGLEATHAKFETEDGV